MQKVLGALIILMSVFGGYMWAGGSLLAIWQPAEILIIGGAAIGATIVGNPPPVLKEMRLQLRSVMSAPKDEREYNMELMALLQVLLDTSRRTGFKSLDSHIVNPEQSSIFAKYPLVARDFRLVSFITDNMRLMAMGQMSPHELEGLLEQEIEAIQTDLLLPSRS